MWVCMSVSPGTVLALWCVVRVWQDSYCVMHAAHALSMLTIYAVRPYCTSSVRSGLLSLHLIDDLR